MKNCMDSCELVSTVTAISCAIAKCVSKEDLSLIIAIFGQISSTLSTIAVQLERTENKSSQAEEDYTASNVGSPTARVNSLKEES